MQLPWRMWYGLCWALTRATPSVGAEEPPEYENVQELVGKILDRLLLLSDQEQADEWRGLLFDGTVDYTNPEKCGVV